MEWTGWQVDQVWHHTEHHDCPSSEPHLLKAFQLEIAEHSCNAAFLSIISSDEPCGSTLNSLDRVNVGLVGMIQNGWGILQLWTNQSFVTGGSDLAKRQDDKFRLRKATVLLAFFVMVFVWWPQDSLASIVTPKYLSWSVNWSALEQQDIIGQSKRINQRSMHLTQNVVATCGCILTRNYEYQHRKMGGLATQTDGR